MKKLIITQLIILVCFFLIFFGLQNPSIYNNSLGLISNNWQNENGERKLVEKPYEELTNDKYIQWDGEHYFSIKNYGYNTEKVGGDYIFAFFPLFPFIWKISNLPPIGILFLNYIFFSISILILIKTLSETNNYFRNLMLSFSLPSIIIFLIPYSEATFMLMVSISIYGFMKKKYWIFFVGFLLASLTRPSFTFLLLSILGTELFYFVRHKNIKLGFVNMFYRIIPLLIGTLIVSLIQYGQGSGEMFKFIEVQKYWDNILTVPHNLRDWSHEGFAINIGIIFLIFIPLLVLFLQLFHNQFFVDEKQVLNYKISKDYLLILSLLYLIGNCLFIILFRGGSLHCLFRFTICSPFFYIMLYTSFDYIRHIPANFRLFLISILGLSSFFVLGLVDFSTFWNFSDFGFFVLIATISLWFFQDLQSRKIYKTGIVILLLINLVWTTYLFNTYLINGWIFA
jgi:hypothetical protein